MTIPAAWGRTVNNIDLNPDSPDQRYNNNRNMPSLITLKQVKGY